MAFIGVLGLKISAYAQPLLEKAADKWPGRSDASSVTAPNDKNK
jgi:hypothetical protein